MNCTAALQQLTPYLDGEVSATETLSLERHLRQCPACAAQFARQRAWQVSLHDQVDYHAAPPELVARIKEASRAVHAARPQATPAELRDESHTGPRDEVHTLPRDEAHTRSRDKGHTQPRDEAHAEPRNESRAGSRDESHIGSLDEPRNGSRTGLRAGPRGGPYLSWSRFVAALTATAVTASIATAFLTVAALRSTNEQATMSDVVATHVQATLNHHAIEVASSDQHTVKPWLSSRLDYSPPVADFAARGFALVGGRIEKLDRRNVATLVYRYGNHTIDAFVQPDMSTTTASVASERGFTIIRFARGGFAWTIVADVKPDKLMELATLLNTTT